MDSKLRELRFNLRESDSPFFKQEELLFLLEKNNGDVKKASYEGLLLKAEQTGLSVSGLTTKDSSSYFKMLASRYVETNTGCLC